MFVAVTHCPPLHDKTVLTFVLKILTLMFAGSSSATNRDCLLRVTKDVENT